MKKKVSVLGVAATLARGGQRLLNVLIALMLILALLFGGYSLWDTWKIYHDAALSEEWLKYRPEKGEGANPSLGELMAMNADVRAWLQVDDTNIDYPVVQGDDNMEYLNRSVETTFSLAGSIFMDYRNAGDCSDYYTLIYGHHIAGEIMFGQVPYFLESDYFNSHTTGTLFLPETTYSISWYACLETTAYDTIFQDPTNYNDREQRSQLLDYIRQNATQYRDIGVTADDHIVGLYTCAEAVTDGRVLLVGRLEQDS